MSRRIREVAKRINTLQSEIDYLDHEAAQLERQLNVKRSSQAKYQETVQRLQRCEDAVSQKTTDLAILQHSMETIETTLNWAGYPASLSAIQRSRRQAERAEREIFVCGPQYC